MYNTYITRCKTCCQDVSIILYKEGDNVKLDNVKFENALAERGMTLKELYSVSNVSDNTLLAIRKGKVTPRPATIGRIAKALGVDVRDIIQEGDSNDRMER